MNAEENVSFLESKKKLGFRIVAIQAWGRPLVRPDDTSLELIEIRARGNDLVLTLSPNVKADQRAGAIELAIETTSQAKLTDKTIEFASASYVRLGETMLLPSAGKVRFCDRRGVSDLEAIAGAAALVLTKES